MLDKLPSEQPNDTVIHFERFSDIADSLHYLFTDMWSDISRDQAIPPMDVDYARYIELDRIGVLRTFTVRWRGELVGVAVFFVSPNLHHRSSKWATCDAIWIRPDARRPMVSMRLIRFSENMLFAEGAEIIRMGAKVRRPALAHLLTHMGYDAVEIHYQKVRP